MCVYIIPGQKLIFRTWIKNEFDTILKFPSLSNKEVTSSTLLFIYGLNVMLVSQSNNF